MSALRLSSEQFLALSGKLPQQNKQVVIANGYKSRVQGWRTIGLKEHYFKSLWEINYAHYLQFLKNNNSIHDWEYEPKIFEFPRTKYKIGPFAYKPDFKVFLTKKNYEWHEVKGFLNPASKKKIKRFNTHFPKEGKLIVIGKEWFYSVGKNFSKLIPDWERLSQKP